MNKQLFGSSRGSAMKAVAIAGRTCAVLLVGLLVSGRALAQQSCIRGMHIDGVITDPTGAVIPGAKVQAGNGATGVTDATGHYVFACVPLTSTTITAGRPQPIRPGHRPGTRSCWRRRTCQSPACCRASADRCRGARECKRGRRPQRKHCDRRIYPNLARLLLDGVLGVICQGGQGL